MEKLFLLGWEQNFSLWRRFISGEKEKTAQRSVATTQKWRAATGLENAALSPPPPIKQRRWKRSNFIPFLVGRQHEYARKRNVSRFAASSFTIAIRSRDANFICQMYNTWTTCRMPGINVTPPPPSLVSLTFATLPRTNGSRRANSRGEIVRLLLLLREREREREVRRYVISVVSSFAFITLDCAIFPPNSSLQTIVRGF